MRRCVSIAKQISNWPGWPRFAVLLKGAESRKMFVGAGASSHALSWQPDNRSSVENGVYIFGGGAGRMHVHVGRESRNITPELYQQCYRDKFYIGDIIYVMHVPRYCIYTIAQLDKWFSCCLLHLHRRMYLGSWKSHIRHLTLRL